MNHDGDSVIAQFDSEDAESVQIAQKKLTAFLKECVEHYGAEPPVWGRRSGAKGIDMLDKPLSDLGAFEEVICHAPLAGS